MFTVSALPASFGDCLWIEYGPDDAPNVILIDAGPSVPAVLKDRLQQLAARGGKLELVVGRSRYAEQVPRLLRMVATHALDSDA